MKSDYSEFCSPHVNFYSFLSLQDMQRCRYPKYNYCYPCKCPAYCTAATNSECICENGKAAQPTFQIIQVALRKGKRQYAVINVSSKLEFKFCFYLNHGPYSKISSNIVACLRYFTPLAKKCRRSDNFSANLAIRDDGNDEKAALPSTALQGRFLAEGR